MKVKKKLFKKLLSDLKSIPNSIDEYKYIGTGNPYSDILIVGKEAAISKGSEQYQREIVDNFNYWSNMEEYDSKDIIERDLENYSALYPYKGQILKKDNGKNWGTSKTWINYQKLINYLFDNNENSLINFHEKSFITEINSTPSKITANADIESIPFRKKHILTSDYFQSFSIVIISGVGYFEISEHNNEIEQIFNVIFMEKKYADNEKKSQPYWIHCNKQKTKIVINTYQLSIGVAEILLKEISKEIKNANLLKR
ncbi:hypothetical protein [Flavobacterium tistrianum]|uniref:hypothetical protein n=1 Tax=Flavobacterium tistrianum TaxID=1685414 RepID=UPI000DAE72BE|nr:hypothetical protein [Flavobacterium tistrianum]KAF2342271.1 hypothetical protein DMB71_05095 [Flavobacterium tistrianum]